MLYHWAYPPKKLMRKGKMIILATLISLAPGLVGLFVYNVTLGPMSVANIFQWLGFIACPLVGGILFIRLRKKK